MTRAFGLTIRKMFIDNKRIFIRFIVSLTVCIALIGVLCSVTAFAADNNASGNAGTTSAITDTTSGKHLGRYAVGGFVGDEGSYRGRRLAVA